MNTRRSTRLPGVTAVRPPDGGIEDRRPDARVIGPAKLTTPSSAASGHLLRSPNTANLARMAADHEREDERTKRRRQRQRAATRHERAARTDRQAADAAELFGEAGAAEDHREDARRHETAADDERHTAD
jgi:hypothetical protein